MSQYGSQQYGQGQSQQDPSAAGANGYGDQSQGGYGGQDQGQDPSQGGYGQDQSQQDPSAGYGQQDANQAGGDPDSQQNGYGQQDANQAGGDPDSQQNGYGGQDQSQQSQGQMKGGAGAVAKKQQGGAVQKRQNPKHAHYSESHHNALHHAGQVASEPSKFIPL